MQAFSQLTFNFLMTCSLNWQRSTEITVSEGKEFDWPFSGLYWKRPTLKLRNPSVNELGMPAEG
jgi:hypothetical protein